MASPDYKFTGLILLSSLERVGVEEELMEVLAPFTLKVVEVQRIQLRGRLIVGALISCDPVHAAAIEEDISAFSLKSGLDVAVDFSPVL